MHKFERKFHVLGKREKFLGWVSFRLPFEAPGRFQIQRESREKWIGMEKAHDGRALTNSFMKGLSGLLHKEQHHVFKAWVCIKQSFFYLMNLIQFVSILQKSPDWGWGRALWGHRIMKVGKDLPRSSSPAFQVHPQYPGAAFSLWCFIRLHILCGIPGGLWSIISRDVCFSERGCCGKSSGVHNQHVVTLSFLRVVPVYWEWGGRRNHWGCGQPTDEPPSFN